MVVTTNTPDYVYRIWRTSGSTASSYAAPTTNTCGCDFGAIGSTGYNFVCTGSMVYRMGWNSGSIYGFFATPNGNTRGVAFRPYGNDGYIILTEYVSNGRLWRCNWSTGSVYASYTLNFAPYDIAHDSDRGCYWVADTTNKCIRRITYMGSTLESFSVPYTPFGLGYEPEPGRKYVWVGRNDADYIYVYETAGTAVAPSSMGKIKAIFR